MAEAQAQTVSIDGKDYKWDDLSQEARAALINLNAVDGELRRLRMQTGIAQTARKAFADQLRGLLAQ